MNITAAKVDALIAAAVNCAAPRDLGEHRAPEFIERVPSCDWIVIHGRDYADFRRAGRDRLEVGISTTEFQLGLQGFWDGVPIITSRQIPEGSVFFIRNFGLTKVSRLQVIR